MKFLIFLIVFIVVGCSQPIVILKSPICRDFQDLGPNDILEWDHEDYVENLVYTVHISESTPLEAVATTTKTRINLWKLIEPEKSYLWMVSVTNGDSTSTSSVCRFTTRSNVEPSTPRDPNPEDGSEDVDPNVTLSWACSDPDGDPLEYEVYLGDDPDSVYELEISALSTVTASTEISLKLVGGKYYYWRVVASDGWKGSMAVGPLWMFRTELSGNSPPSVPSDPNPPDGAVVHSSSVEFSWRCSDPDNDDIEYDLFLSSVKEDLKIVAKGLRESRYSTNLSEGEYRWMVVARDSNGLETEGPVWRFSVSFSRMTYYVSPDGDDSNPGTEDSPWKTPSVAVKRLSPGDTLVFFPGVYIIDSEEDIVSPNSGTPDMPINLVASGDVVIEGCENVRTAFDLSGVEYVTIDGFEITHSDSCGNPFFRDAISALDGHALGIVLRNIHVHHVDEFGLNIADFIDSTVEDSTFSNCGFGGMGGPQGLEGGWKNVTIRKVYLGYSGWYYQNGNEANNPYDRPDGVGLEESEGPLVIEDCIVEHNRGDGIDSKVERTLVRRCVVSNNSCDGVKIWGSGSRIENVLVYGKGDGDSTPSPWGSIVIDQVETPGATFEIVNVTIHDPLSGSYPIYIGYTGSATFSVLFRNVIVLGSTDPVYFGSVVDLQMDHSLIYIPNSERQVEYAGRSYSSVDLESGMLGEGNLSRDPMFSNPVWGSDFGDYHLLDNSPAVDSGTCEGAPSDDLDGNERPIGGGCDMGAYER